MASLTWWTWAWVNSGSWWWTGRPGVLWFMGSQRVGHDWATELNWTEGCSIEGISCVLRTTICQVFFSVGKPSVQFSRSVVSDSLRPRESQHARPPCPSPTPRVHVHWVSDAIEPSHLLLSPSPPAPNPSQHQSLFQWVNSSHEVAKVLEFQL